jgi:hypothetical protein
MNESVSNPPEGDSGAFDLGILLGQRQAFSLLAGRCSAADADCLRRLRDEQLYKLRDKNWDEFCTHYLGMSRSNADRIIRLLEEFGPAYFELAQLTRISPEAYRSIAPAVSIQAICLNGEAIALVAENAGKVAAAVAELRKAARPESAGVASIHDRLNSLERRCQDVAAEFAALSAAQPKLDELTLLNSVLETMRSRLLRIDLELNPPDARL